MGASGIFPHSLPTVLPGIIVMKYEITAAATAQQLQTFNLEVKPPSMIIEEAKN